VSFVSLVSVVSLVRSCIKRGDFGETAPILELVSWVCIRQHQPGQLPAGWHQSHCQPAGNG